MKTAGRLPDYLLPVKENQPMLLSKVSGLMDDLILRPLLA
jgi:hypothetical protein